MSWTLFGAVGEKIAKMASMNPCLVGEDEPVSGGRGLSDGRKNTPAIDSIKPVRAAGTGCTPPAGCPSGIFPA
jgi:hypothetical protein